MLELLEQAPEIDTIIVPISGLFQSSWLYLASRSASASSLPFTEDGKHENWQVEDSYQEWHWLQNPSILQSGF